MAFNKSKGKDAHKNTQRTAEPVKAKMCYLCVQNISDVSPRDTMTLRRFVSSFMKIAPQRRSGLCAKHQRKMARAIKVSRELGLLPYVVE